MYNSGSYHLHKLHNTTQIYLFIWLYCLHYIFYCRSVYPFHKIIPNHLETINNISEISVTVITTLVLMSY
nr:MAG TPA: hypothetical protein [Caudoviricetes sp.]